MSRSSPKNLTEKADLNFPPLSWFVLNHQTYSPQFWFKIFKSWREIKKCGDDLLKISDFKALLPLISLCETHKPAVVHPCWFSTSCAKWRWVKLQKNSMDYKWCYKHTFYRMKSNKKRDPYCFLSIFFFSIVT